MKAGRTTHRDKPDFYVIWDGSVLGIEITNFLAESRAHAEATALRLSVGLTLSRFRLETERKTKQEMEDAVHRPSTGLLDWKPIEDPKEVEHFVHLVEEKVRKVLSQPRSNTTDNWLLIYDKHRLSDIALTFLTRNAWHLLQPHWQATPSFSRILILSENVLVELTQPGAAWTNV